MKNHLFSILFMFVSVVLFGQDNLNMTLVSNVQFNENSSDIWGYVDGNGIEYAIIGTATNTRVYSLEDPANPVERALIPGASSIWRDMKSWNDRIYVTTDQGIDGIFIINMSGAPENITATQWQPTLNIEGTTGVLERCHNIYIDEKGYGYLAGCNIANKGVIIIDLNGDPDVPEYLGSANLNYSHDAYARGDTLYSSEINIGEFSIYDVSDRTDPIYLGGAETSMNFCHNAWLSDDGKTLFTTDERGNANVDSYDISDLGNLRRLDTYHPLESSGTGTIPHNTHVLNDYLVTSWYTDGVVVTDVSDPSNIIKVGSYDTWDGPNGGFNGAWGAYPYLPSGLVLVSDINTGLYVFQPNYVAAARLQGIVRDQATGLAINNVTVNIVDSQANATNTDPSGEYKTGIVSTGIKVVEFSHPEYFTKSSTVNMNNGSTATLDMQLERKQEVSFNVITLKANDGTSLADCQVWLENEDNSIRLTTDADGNLTTSIIGDTYNLYVGKWGYLQYTQEIDLFNQPSITVSLEEGYQDDFIFDLGWTTSSDASSGDWVREIPNGTLFNDLISNPFVDVDNDLGNYAYVTGNADAPGAGTDDIDGGTVTLESPVMDLSSYTMPTVSYNLWFFNAGGNGTEPNDYVRVSITNGVQTVRLEDVTESSSRWRSRSSFDLADLITINDNMKIIIEAADDTPGHLVEAGFDMFLVTEGTTSTQNVNLLNISISPNPFDEFVLISHEIEQEVYITLMNAKGELIKRQFTSQSEITMDVKDLSSGLYILQISNTQGEILATEKIIKAK